MTLVFNINASDPASALARSVTVNSPAQKPVFVLGDNPLIQLYISDGAGAYDASSGAAGYVPWLGIGTPGALPSSGAFYLGVSSATSGTLTNGKRYLISTFNAGDDFTNIGGTNLTGNVFTATGTTPTTWTHGSALVEITSDISCPPSASAIQTALNSTHAIGANGVTVTASSSSSLAFVFDFTAVGTRYLTAGYGSGMTPDSSAIVAQLIAGSATVKERQFLRLVANPAALQTTWTAITDGWSGRLSCATRGLVDLLNGATSQLSRLELQLVDGSGNITTVGQVECVIRNEVVDPAALIPVPLPSYLTADESRLAFLQNRYSVTGLTGGGSSLDGVATGTTANPTVATNSFVAIVVSGTAYLYQLVTGTNSESSPDVIRPDDYDGSTNARVWKLRNVGIAAHHATHENGGADEISVAGLSGLLADAQTPLAHATSHKSGGSDAIKLDELAAPTDVTTLNVTASAHGLAPKLSGDSTQYLDGSGSWSVPSQAGVFSLSTTVTRSQNYDVLHKRAEGVMTARTTGTTPTVLASTLSLWSAFPDTNPNSVYPSGVLYFEAEVVAHRSGAGTLERAVWKLSGVAEIDTESISFPDAITKDLVSNSFTGGTPDAEFYTNGVSQIGIRATGLNDGSTKFTVWTAHVSLLLSAADKSIVI